MRRPLRILAYALLAIVALVGLALLALATPPGRSLLAGVIERAASGNGLVVEIGSLSGWPPFRFGADRVVVSDATGVFAEVEDLDVDFRASALLAGGLAFDSIAAGRVTVLRIPDLPESESSGSGGFVPFAVEDLSVARLELGEAIAGRPAALAVTGALTGSSDGSIAVRVSAARIDGQAATLAASVARANGSAPFAVEVDLREGADGILLGLMGRPTGPAYALEAHATLGDDDLSGDVRLTSEGDARFGGRFTLSGAGGADGRRLVLNGEGDLAELVPPDFVGLLSGPVEIAVDASWAHADGKPLPAIEIRRGMVSTAGVSASASGSLGAAAADLTVSLKVADPDGGPVSLPFLGEGARLDRLSLSGRVAPVDDAVRLDLVGQVAGLETAGMRVPGIGLSLAVEADRADPLATRALPFALRIEADAIETPAGDIVAGDAAPLLLTAGGTFDTAAAIAEAEADLAAAGGAAAFAGTVDGGVLRGRLSAAFASLDRLAPLVGLPLAGAVDIVAEGTFTGPATAFTVSGTAEDLDPGDATAARFLKGSTGISASVARPGDGTTAITGLVIDGEALDAAGAATFAAGTAAVTLEGSLADLGLLAGESRGAATFTLRTSGPLAEPEIDATIAVDEGVLLGQAVADAAVSLEAAPSGAGWQAALVLRGSVAGGPLTGRATATLEPGTGQLALPEIDLAVGANTITGAVRRTAGGQLDGALTVDAPELRTLAALALVEAAGSARVEVRFAPDGDRQSVAAAFNARDITASSVLLSAVEGEVRVEDAFGTPQVRGNASATGVSAGGLALDTAEASATVEDGVTRFEAQASGPDMDLAGAGTLSDADGARAVRIERLAGTAFDLPVQLGDPVTLTLGEGASRLSGATLALGGGTVRVDGAVAPALDLTVVIDGVSASLANGFVPDLGAGGTISGRAAVTGAPDAPAVAWRADWSGLRLAATTEAGLPPLTLAASGEATLARTSLEARLTGAGLSLTISGRVPFAGGGLDLGVRGSAPLALLALESDRELRLAGTASLDVSVGGSLDAVAVTGGVDLVDATVADADSGFGIAGASGRIDFDGGAATVRDVSGRLSQGGTIVIAGSIDTMAAGLPANLTVRVRDGRYADGSIVDARFTADLAVDGPLLGGGTVSGRVDLGRTEVRLPDRTGSATAIDVRHVNAAPGFTPPTDALNRPSASAASSSGGAGGLSLDIAVAASSGLFVRGFGIDAELGGTLTVGGTTDTPVAAGGFDMRRGRMEVIGRRFDFTSGTLTFAGSLTPYVDFSATASTSDAVVTLNVVGPADDPDIRFTSSPQMPEEEILSRLLFDRSVGSLSALQAVQLVDAVAQLTGAIGEGGIFARIRQATGLDDLDIRQNESGGTTVGVGRRINENIRLGVEAGTGGEPGRVVIDLDITRGLKARTEAGEDGSGKVGLSYEREY